MANSLSGFRVLEVAAWTFVPAAGAVMADWGADVIKVEHPVGGEHLVFRSELPPDLARLRHALAAELTCRIPP